MRFICERETMPSYVGKILKVRCENCIGWGKIVNFQYGEEEKKACSMCGGRGWNATRMLILVEPKKKPKRPNFWAKNKKPKESWKNLPGVPEGF